MLTRRSVVSLAWTDQCIREQAEQYDRLYRQPQLRYQQKQKQEPQLRQMSDAERQRVTAETIAWLANYKKQISPIERR